jgi:glutamate formiminotransferase
VTIPPPDARDAPEVLECVVNISEGQDLAAIDAIAGAAGADLLDVHTDPHHHRSVLTLVGEDAPRAVATAAIERLDLTAHHGVHPRIGVVDVVPFVPLAGSTFDDALAARDRFASWLADTHDVPCFRYGPERTLPDIRRGAFGALPPDTGPAVPHRTAGACAVGARALLVAYNVWLTDPDATTATALARAVRGDGLRSLGLVVGDRAQVSMNLVEPLRVGPAEAFDRVAAAAADVGATIAGAELVGLVPEAVLAAVPAERWTMLDLAADRTIEARSSAR